MSAMAEIVLTQHEQRLLASAWQCFEGTPNIDFDKLAGLMGHTNIRTTRNLMSVVRKKVATPFLCSKPILGRSGLLAYTTQFNSAAGAVIPLAPLTPAKGTPSPKKGGTTTKDSSPTKSATSKKRKIAEESDSEDIKSEVDDTPIAFSMPSAKFHALNSSENFKQPEFEKKIKSSNKTASASDVEENEVKVKPEKTTPKKRAPSKKAILAAKKEDDDDEMVGAKKVIPKKRAPPAKKAKKVKESTPEEEEEEVEEENGADGNAMDVDGQNV